MNDMNLIVALLVALAAVLSMAIVTWRVMSRRRVTSQFGRREIDISGAPFEAGSGLTLVPLDGGWASRWQFGDPRRRNARMGVVVPTSELMGPELGPSTRPVPLAWVEQMRAQIHSAAPTATIVGDRLGAVRAAKATLVNALEGESVSVRLLGRRGDTVSFAVSGRVEFHDAPVVGRGQAKVGGPRNDRRVQTGRLEVTDGESRFCFHLLSRRVRELLDEELAKEGRT